MDNQEIPQLLLPATEDKEDLASTQQTVQLDGGARVGRTEEDHGSR